MSRNLYNREFVINDAIVAAHPHGGTTIVDIDSPSGGEGRVLDIIERQALTIKRLIHPNKIIHRLAELSAELDSIGCVDSAFAIMKMADGVPGPDEMTYADRDTGKSLVGEDIDTNVSAGKLTEEDKPEELSKVKKHQKIFEMVLKHLDNIQSFVDGFRELASKVPDADLGEINTAVSRIKAVHEACHQFIFEFIQTGESKKAWIELGHYKRKYLIDENTILNHLHYFYKDVPKILKDIKDPGTGHLWDDSLTDNEDFKEDFAKIFNGISRSGEILAHISTTFGGKGLVTNKLVDKAYNSLYPPKSQDGAPRFDDSKLFADEREKYKDPPGLPKTRMSPPREQPQSAGDISNWVGALQTHIGIKATKVYDQDTHSALFDYLLNLSRQKDADGQLTIDAKRAQVLMDKHYDDKSLSNTAAQAQYMLNALKGVEGYDPLAAPAEVKGPLKIHYIDFISPTGGHITDFPVGALLHEMKSDPYILLRRLSMSGAIKQRGHFETAADFNRYLEAVINHPSLLNHITLSMTDSLEAAGLPKEKLPIFKSHMDDVIMSLKGLADKENERNPKIHVMKALEKISPQVASQLASSPDAVKQYVNRYFMQGYADADGFITEQVAKSSFKNWLRNDAEHLIRELKLTGRGRLPESDNKKNTHMSNLSEVKKIADEIVKEMLSSSSPTNVMRQRATDSATIDKLDSMGYDTDNDNLNFQHYLKQLYVWKKQGRETDILKNIDDSSTATPPGPTTPTKPTGGPKPVVDGGYHAPAHADPQQNDADPRKKGRP